MAPYSSISMHQWLELQQDMDDPVVEIVELLFLLYYNWLAVSGSTEKSRMRKCKILPLPVMQYVLDALPAVLLQSFQGPMRIL